MGNSFSLNSIDMSVYGLVVTGHDLPFVQQVDSFQVLDRAYGSNSVHPAKEIIINVAIGASSVSTLNSYLDSVSKNLNLREDAELHLDTISDRYWIVRFVSFLGRLRTLNLWEGQITFVAHDPAAYNSSETTSGPHAIDDDPQEVSVSIGGTEQTHPIYILTCNSTLNDTTVKIENEATGEIVEWTGDLISIDILEIDADAMIIKLNETEEMLSVDGQFPVLIPGANILNISGFSGTLSIVYRARYV